MHKICTQCKDSFIESTIQHYRRMSKDLPITCKSCYRIQEAESRALKRSLVKSRHVQSEYGVKKPNITSIMIKYKVNYEKAKEMLPNLIQIYENKMNK